jgi:hypothetical protein
MSLRGATPEKPERTLIIFARAPDRGRVKTRLVPLLGKKGAARLHARLVVKTLKTVIAAGFEDTYLFCAPSMKNDFFQEIQERFGVRLCPQGRGDLGERMYRALRRHPGAVLIGTDCPALRPADLRAAARALRAGSDAVLSPAEDGGYALIGVRRVAHGLFKGVDWGSARVLAQTRRRFRRLHWQWTELRTVWDVDRPADVARLRKTGSLGKK